MRPLILRSTAAKLFLAIATVALCSFDFVPGQASYEVYLNNERVINEHLYGQKEAPTLPLNTTTEQDELSVTFNNCGKIDTGRKISLKNEQDKTLREWSFSDSPDIKNKMEIRVSEITAFRQQHSTAKLVYSSREFSTDVHLITLQLGNATAQN
jgi:S-adenosylmethionine:tRNA-ribosyltransferase-isomerase (queuine synthetase)